MDVIHGAWLASAMGIFFGWAVLAWIVRVWAKVRTKSWALDDYAISGAVVCISCLFSFFFFFSFFTIFFSFVDECLANM